MLRVDVLVVGAGPTGLTAAGDLARCGRSVAVLERWPQVNPSSRAFATMALFLATPAAAQLGAATQSPPPAGVEEGQGAANPKGHYAALDQLPDWGGIWFMMAGPPGSGAAPPQPKLKGEYLARREAWVAEVRARDGVARRARSNCSPPGMPRIMRLAQYPYEFVFAPGRVTVNQEAWMQTRTIWTDGRAHEEDPDPTFMSDSVGQ